MLVLARLDHQNFQCSFGRLSFALSHGKLSLEHVKHTKYINSINKDLSLDPFIHYLVSNGRVTPEEVDRREEIVAGNVGPFVSLAYSTGLLTTETRTFSTYTSALVLS